VQGLLTASDIVNIRRWKFPGVFTDGDNLLTKNLSPSNQVYGEDLVLYEGEEFRIWNPKRSKACAMLKKGSKFFPMKEDSQVLYLGAASGTTASHISDITVNGTIYCVEFSKRSFRDLVPVCEIRRNMMPILADANKPEMYRNVVSKVDIVYQDISQRDQVRIFLKNIQPFLKSGGFGMLMVKARSIDVTANPKDIYKEAERELRENGMKLLESLDLRPFEKDHAALIVQR
jgi:fibrillarin-like pre-rRNA processing protein